MSKKKTGNKKIDLHLSFSVLNELQKNCRNLTQMPVRKEKEKFKWNLKHIAKKGEKREKWQ